MRWILGFCILLEAYSTKDFFVVETRCGPIRGKRITSRNRSGIVFAGIPLSVPPLGGLRFRVLQNPSPWTEVLDTFNYRNACLSNPLKTYAAQGGGPISEDCMYTNVFSSEACLAKGGCGVMVVIHGGARNFESPVIYDQGIIVHNFANDERNVVVVSIPYRLGVFGWLHLAPGLKTSAETNLTMRDILFNLEWIQREISHFGGDPTRVTLMGHSAGSVMALEIALTPLSEGLFSQLIHMSGFSTGGDRTRDVNSKFSRKMAHMLNCAKEKEDYSNLTRVEEVIECLRRKTGKEMLDAQFVMQNYVEENHGTWIDGEGGVFPNYMKDLLAKPKKISVLLGTVAAEQRDTRFVFESPLTGNPDRVDEVCLHLAYERNYENPEGFRRIRNQNYGQENLTEFMNDDLTFYYHAGSLANTYSTQGDVFVYSFEYEGGRKAFARAQKEYLGPSHADDFMFVFGLHRIEEYFDGRNIAMEEEYTGMMASFVNSGKPKIGGYEMEEWDKGRRNHFVIDMDDQMTMEGMRDGYYREAHEFWESEAFRAGGNWRPLTDFPPEVDLYTENAISISLVAQMNGFSVIYDKNLQAQELTYKTWKKHLEHLRENVVFVEEDTTSSGNVLFFSVLLVGVCGLFIGGYCLIVRFCRQKEYEEITP